jgi:hypothetical protein
LANTTKEWAFKQLCVLNITVEDHKAVAYATLAIYDKYLHSQREFIQHEKQKVSKATQHGTILDKSKFTIFTKATADLEKFGLVLIGCCVPFASMLGNASQEYKVLEMVLHNLSLSNHLAYSTSEDHALDELSFCLKQSGEALHENPNLKTSENHTILMKQWQQEFEKCTGTNEFVDPSLIGMTIGKAFDQISTGGPNSFHE